MKPFFLSLVTCFFLLNATAQKKQTIVIQTSAECGQCKERIEGKLNYTKGISFAELDVPTKQCTVKYDTEKISKEEILQEISKLGYDADGVKANQEAYENLPQCCKVNMHKE